MTFPEGGSVKVETSLDGGHDYFQSVAATSISLLLATLVGERTSGSDKLNQSRCNGKSNVSLTI